MSAKSISFVTIQLAAIGYLLATGRWLATVNWVWLEIGGGILALWALWAMPPRQLRVFPEVADRARLVTRGPYRWVRHPMYLSVLVTTLALVLAQSTPARLAVWCVLLGDLLTKLRYEESLLAARFPDYAGYQQRTKRLVPFVY